MKLVLLCLLLSVGLSAYDQNLSKLTAAYAAIAHCTKASIEAWSCKLCKSTQALTEIHYIENTEFHNVGVIGYNSIKNTIVVAWRGSIDARNWAEDFSFELINYSKCKSCQIHIGFNFAYKAVEKQLLQYLDTLIAAHPTASITVTGHSLGGAMATISALELQLKYNKVAALYAFGCPRIGNIHLSQYINLKIAERYRPIHNRDLYAHLPFIEMGFHHYGREVFYNEDFTEYKVCNDGGEDSTCSAKYFPNFTPADHEVYFYNMDTTIC